MKRILALILALLMLVVLFAACKDKNNPNDNPDDQGDKGKTKDGDIVIRNFEGADYTILTNSYTDYEFNGTRAGDIVKYAVAERQETVEDTFGVNVKVMSIKGGWGERDSFTNAVRTEKTSKGTDGINLIATHSVYLGWMGVEGLGQDMAQYSDYIDFAEPWWNRNLYDALNLKGHVFMMIGDIAYTLYEYINVMFVNNSQFQSYFVDQGGTEMLYDLVEAGEWTWEKLWDFASDFGTGAMGDGKYGIATNTHAWRATFVSQEATLYDRDASGKLSLSDALNKKTSDIVREMVEMYRKDNLDFVVDFNGTHASTYTPMFTANLILFYPQTLDEATKIFSSNNTDYGVVPLPKYDTMQELYKTQCRDTVTGVMILNSATNDPKGKNEGEMAAIVTEGMAYYGYKLITPAYYEKSLTDRYLSRYSDILDTIRAGLTYPDGLCYVQNSSGGNGTMNFDKFHQLVHGSSDVQADTSYAQTVATGRSELQSFYYKLGKLGITY